MDAGAILSVTTYPGLFLFAVLEGPVTMTAVGFLLRMGTFHFWPAYAALVLGDLTADIGWYALGYVGAHRFIARYGKYFSLTESSQEKISRLFRKHEGRILLASKLTMGFGLAIGVLFSAGMSRVPMKKFIALNFLGGLIWTAFLLFLGYVFGHLYLQISSGLRIASMVVFVLFLGFALHGFRAYMKQRVFGADVDRV